jgi:DNA invertase Pin-like site-specific DNA recombinase
MTSSRIRRAGILARISLDRDGASESPDQQLGDGHALAQQRHLDVVETYVERDVSGFSREVARPEYDRLVRDMRAGRIDVVIVWAIDRLTRQGVVGIARFLAVMEETGVELVSVTQPFLDTTTPLGRGVLAMIASLAEQESANTSARVRRNHRYAARQGKLHGGGSRLFGYRQRFRDGNGGYVVLPDDTGPAGSVVEAEAEVIRKVRERVLEGQSLRSICVDLNARGVRTPLAGALRRQRRPSKADPPGELREVSGEWSARTLSNMLRSPRLAGLIEYEGRRYRGQWDPILTEEEHDEIVQALTSRPLSQRRGRRYLLTGVVRCGLCGEKLKYMKFRMSNGREFPRYQCVRQPGFGHCGKVAASMAAVDGHVTARLLDFLAHAQLRPMEGEDSEADLERQLVEAQGALTDLVRERFVRRTIGADDFEKAREELDAEVSSLERRLVGVRRATEDRTAQLPLGDRAALEGWWEAADQDQRRAAAHWALGSVTVAPARRRGGNVFDAARLDVAPNWSVLMLAADRYAEDAGLADATLEELAEDERRWQAEQEAELANIAVTEEQADAMGPAWGEAWRRVAHR